MRKACGFAVTLTLLVSLVLISGDVRAGSPVGGKFLIYDNTGVSEALPSIAYNGQSQEYLVVWQAEYSGPIYEIWGRRVSSSGAPLGAAFRISPVGQGSTPDVAYSSAANGYLVVWKHNVGIYGQRVSASGALQDSVLNIAIGITGSCDQPVVAYGSVADRYLVTYRYSQDADGSTGIWANSMESDGGFDGAAFLVHGHSNTLLPEQPDLAYNRSRNEFLVVWQQTFGPGDRDICGGSQWPAGQQLWARHSASRPPATMTPFPR